MSFKIHFFNCTNLGNSVLLDKHQPNETLSDNEMTALLLIQQYHKGVCNISKRQLIEKEFEQLYDQVNLTRLVVLKFLTFSELAEASVKVVDGDETINPMIEIISGKFE